MMACSRPPAPSPDRPDRAVHRTRFIVIEGLIGVGKTTLCRLLKDRWRARLVLEPWDDNPFLAAFYSDPERYAFPTQMFYLANRYFQQVRLARGEITDPVVVADYLFEKDRLFAEETLKGDEMALYDKFAGLLGGTIPAPEFVLFLDAPTEVIRKRIARRAIEAEQVIAADYLDSLRRRYYALWDRYDAAPVYVLDSTAIDYVNDPASQEHMLAMLQGWLDGEPIPGAPQPYHGRVGPKQLHLFGQG